MNRRLGGLLMVVLVMLAAVVVPGVSGRTVPGLATLAPIPGPPAVGDCLTVRESTSWAQNDRPAYTPQKLGACQGSRYGEVVAVTHDARPRGPVLPTIPAPGDESEGARDPNQTTCSDAAIGYLGLHRGADRIGTMSDDWEPLSQIESSPSGPSALQASFGQDWVACVLFVENGDGNSLAYSGSLRNAYVTGDVPSAFAFCLGSTDITNGQVVPCEKPHPAEAFGIRNTATAGLTQQSLDASCLALVGRLTKLSDPTAGGQLQVDALAVHYDAADRAIVGLGGPKDLTGQAVCLVVAPTGRQLGGSVLALHGGPIPWAS